MCCGTHLGVGVAGVLLAATSYEVFRTQCFTRGAGNLHIAEVESVTAGSNEEAIEWLQTYHRREVVGVSPRKKAEQLVGWMVFFAETFERRWEIGPNWLVAVKMC